MHKAVALVVTIIVERDASIWINPRREWAAYLSYFENLLMLSILTTTTSNPP